MIIDAVIFIAWIILMVVIGAVIALGEQRRRRLTLQAMDNVENERALSFPQRHRLLLCLAVSFLIN